MKLLATVLHWTEVVLAFLLLGLVLWISVSRRRSKQVQDQVVENISGRATQWFRVYVARPAHWKSFWKFIGYEGRGVLYLEDGHYKLVARTHTGKSMEAVFDPASMQIDWRGNPGLASGNLHWFSMMSGDQQWMICADVGVNAVMSRQEIADMLRKIDPHFELPDLARQEFHIEKNKAAIALVAVFFLFLLYGLVDLFMVYPRSLLNQAWYLMAAIPLHVSAYLAYPWLVRSSVPSREAMVLTLLLGLSFVMGGLPLVLRLDAALSRDGVRSVEYEMVGARRFVAVDRSSPAIWLRGQEAYWAQYGHGSRHQFDIVHGPMGTIQLDTTRLNERLREFRDRR